MADSLKSAGFYDEAITEYMRHAYFHDGARQRSEAFSRIGFCHAFLESWDEAIDAANIAIDYAATDSLLYQRKTDRAVILLASRSLPAARRELEQILNLSRHEKIKERAGLALFICAVLEHDWQTAQSLHYSTTQARFAKADSIGSALKRASIAPRKSPQTAKLLSTLLPGAGQFYLGRWFAGLNALALCGGLGYLTVDLVASERYIGGFVAFTWLFLRYYDGNREQAYAAAVRHNETTDLAYEKAILRLLE